MSEKESFKHGSEKTPQDVAEQIARIADRIGSKAIRGGALGLEDDREISAISSKSIESTSLADSLVISDHGYSPYKATTKEDRTSVSYRRSKDGKVSYADVSMKRGDKHGKVRYAAAANEGKIRGGLDYEAPVKGKVGGEYVDNSTQTIDLNHDESIKVAAKALNELRGAVNKRTETSTKPLDEFLKS